MKINIAWHNTFQNKIRTIAAVSGISFAVLLIFMQLGFLNMAKTTSTMLYRYLDFDLILTSNTYENLNASGRFLKFRLNQVEAIDGVARAIRLNRLSSYWLDKETGKRSSVMLLGIDLDPSFIKDKEMKSNIKSLKNANTIMLDSFSHKDFGDISIGRTGNLNGRDVTVTSLFKLGMAFYKEGSVLVNNENFYNLTNTEPSLVSIGLIKVLPNVDPLKVKDEIKKTLPDNVIIHDRKTFIKAEADFFISVKPIGIMFKAGVFIAFAVGAVILFQVLSTEISTKLDEFATLKALGFNNLYIYMVGTKQAFLFAVMSYLPAMIFAYMIFFIVQKLARLQMNFTIDLALTVLFLTILMCAISSYFALMKVKNADPAELF